MQNVKKFVFINQMNIIIEDQHNLNELKRHRSKLIKKKN